jgi:hypothetical protein
MGFLRHLFNLFNNWLWNDTKTVSIIELTDIDNNWDKTPPTSPKISVYYLEEDTLNPL